MVRQRDRQHQDLAGLNRDAAGANEALSPIFDKEKEQLRLQEVKLITDIGGQLLDIAGTSAAITAAEAASEAKQQSSAANRQAAREQLATGSHPNQTPTEEQIKQQIYDTAYNLNLSGSSLGTGGHYRQAAVGVLKVALTGGDITAALAAGGAPYLAEGIKRASGDNDEARYAAHALAGALRAHLQGQDALAGGAGALTGELAAAQIMKQAYPGKTVEQLTEGEKQIISTLGTLAAGLAGGLAGNGTGEAIVGAQMGKNAVENNFLSTPSAIKRNDLAEKIMQGDKTLQTAKEYLELENADKRSDALVSQFKKDPTVLTAAESTELNSYIRLYASDMQTLHGDAVTKELITGMLTGQDYLKSALNTEAQQKAHTIMKTWGYHTSNAGIGDPALLFGMGPLGRTIKLGMVGNATIGVSVNTAVQLSGKDPFSYVDAVMAGVTASATKRKGLLPSLGINMGGAALGSAVKGENPTNAMIGAGLGSVVGGKADKFITRGVSTAIKKSTAGLIGNVGGSLTSKVVSDVVENALDKAELNDDKK